MEWVNYTLGVDELMTVGASKRSAIESNLKCQKGAGLRRCWSELNLSLLQTDHEGKTWGFQVDILSSSHIFKEIKRKERKILQTPRFISFNVQ